MYFETPNAAVLMPNDADYTSWETTYIERVPTSEERRLGRMWHAVRKGERRLLLKPWARWKKNQEWRQRLTRVAIPARMASDP
jgi:hypothetical protein